MSTVKKINSRSTGISYHSPQNLSCTHLLSEGPPHPRHCDTSYPALSSSSSVTALNHLDVLKLTAKRQAGPPLALPTATWHHASTHTHTQHSAWSVEILPLIIIVSTARPRAGSRRPDASSAEALAACTHARQERPDLWFHARQPHLGECDDVMPSFV
jgi:hypothetical protein